MLPKAIPNTRTLQFGYESQWFGHEAIQQRLPLVADQLLHGLLGLRTVCWFVLFVGACLTRCWSIGMYTSTHNLRWPLFWWTSH